jgi:hypothetical protein
MQLGEAAAINKQQAAAAMAVIMGAAAAPVQVIMPARYSDHVA